MPPGDSERPETVQSRREAGALKTYRLEEEGEVLATGLAIGIEIAAGKVAVLTDPGQMDRFPDGGILVAPMTDPDWGPVMARAAGIVTDRGGRTSHAAIVSRELGVPAIVGAGDATSVLEDGREVTLSCAEGDEGKVYRGTLAFEEEVLDLTDVPETSTRERHDRRPAAPRPGHRAHERLQDERVRGADRRPPLRAGRGEPDARVAGSGPEAGIDSISLNPDSVLRTLRRVAKAERVRRGADGGGAP